MCLALMVGVQLRGQVSTASVTGVVRDPRGGMVPEASVVLRHVETGLERQTVTNVAGNYVFVSVQPGTYTLEVKRQGFRTSTIRPFLLEVNQTATFDFALQIGAVDQSVTVEAIGASVQAASSELGSVVTERQVLELPLNGRNFTQLITLTPGASPVNVAQNNNGGGVSTIGDFNYPAMNGQTNRSNFFMTDGVTNFGGLRSTYVVPPIIDSIQEFKVQSHNDQSEFGMVTGGVVNVVTKSGSNEFHGSVFEFLRNDALDARNPFRVDITPLRQNMFGGTAGGRILRNRTFFFVAYQGFRQHTPANTQYNVPTQANLHGDLRDWPNQIFDPFSTRENPSKVGTFIRTPFAGNVIPESRLDRGLLQYLQVTVPAPIQTGIPGFNQLDLTPVTQRQEEYTARLDHNFRANDFVWVRASGQLFDQSGSGGRQTMASTTDISTRNLGGSWVHIFGPASILQVQFGRSIAVNTVTNSFKNLPAGFIKDVGLADEICCSYRSGQTVVPAFNITQFFSGGSINDTTHPGDSYQYKANYSRVFASHIVKFGGEFNTMHDLIISNFASISFNSVQTQDPQSPGQTGSPLASFLLNIPSGADRKDFYKTYRFGGVLGFFAQDSWKATSKLTVNFGFRYDRTFIPPIGTREDGGIYMGDIDYNRGIYVLQAVPASCSQLGKPPCMPTPGGQLPDGVVVDPRGKILHDFTDNWQPRLGLAYRLDQKTAIRASFGMFFDSWSGIDQGAQNLGHSWPDVGRQASANQNVPTLQQPLPVIKGTDPFPNSTLPAATPFTQGAWFADPYMRNPYSMQWNLGVQRQFGNDVLVSLNYVGSGDRRGSMGGYYNVALTPGPGTPQSRAPWPSIVANNWVRSWGRSNYNALQLQVRKRFSNGFSYMLNYTWSKSIDTGCSGSFAEGCGIQDPYHFNNDRSVSAFDLPHILNINWTYQLPFGSGKRFRTGKVIADQIIRNWQVNGIASFNSGPPYSVTLSGDIANTGNSAYMRPNLVGDPIPANPTPSLWINRQAFAVPAQFTFGNAGRNILRSDGTANFDLSLFREFGIPVREGMRVQFRAEAFNALNSPRFAAPSSNLSLTTFGRVLGVSNKPRQMQLAVKVVF